VVDASAADFDSQFLSQVCPTTMHAPRLKVLHFTTTVGGGGAEQMLCNVVEAMARKGIQSVVVSTTSSVGDNSLRSRLEAAGPFYDLDAKSLLSWKMIRQFRRILKDEKPNIVQTWMHNSGVIAGALARMAGVKNVVWGVHSKDIFFGGNPGWMKSFVNRKVLGAASRRVPKRIISCSQIAMRVHEEEVGYPSGKMVWIGNGIDTDRFTPSHEVRRESREKFGIPQDAKVVGMVGRMNPVKDVPTFLRAAAELQKRNPKAHIVLSGQGVEEADEITKSANLELPDPARMHWIGYQKEVEKIYPMFDVMALTSTTEAFPMVLIEAMSCGVPCVSTNVGDAALILGEVGKVTPVGDSEKIGEAWDEILNLDDDSHQVLSSRAREFSVERFGLEHCASRYLQVYEQLLAA
jgi:glycosyltransferase involved in cell wall biosynthesis